MSIIPHLKQLFVGTVLVALFSVPAYSQDNLFLDYSYSSVIPQTIALKASETHLYVLSGSEGMAVFRVYPDSLQWLYTSTGMNRRGDDINTDIRFAYLTGSSNRLTVLEPTSVLGVYSATQLPARPRGTARLENSLFLALGEAGLGRLLLDTPETVDSDVSISDEKDIAGANVLDVAASETGKQLFVLTGNGSLVLFNYKNNALVHTKTFRFNENLVRLFIDGDRFWASTKEGDVFTVNSAGLGRKLGSVEEPVATVLEWQDYTFIRGSSGKIWVSENRQPLKLWKSDGEAGNLITKSSDRLWISENNILVRVRSGEGTTGGETVAPAAPTGGKKFALKKIANKIITYPNPLLLALELQDDYPTDNVRFTYRSNTGNANIQKQGFAWQPAPAQIGLHWFTIIASNSAGQSDSTRFSVDVRSFNAPPTFSPVRNASVVVNELFELNFKAIDPENPESRLIRYIGVDLPLGSQINERTGLFTWTPNERQIGENTFKIIASDEHGAAASISVTLTVLDIE